MSKRLTPFAVLAAVRGARAPVRDAAIVIDGAPALVPVLARELRAGGKASAVREGFSAAATHGVAALVWVGEHDDDVLRAAARAGIPIVAVTDAETVPYVLATDMVRVPAGQGFPVDEVAVALARRLGDSGPSLASMLPVLRAPVVDHLIKQAAVRNALLSAGIFLPGVSMTFLTLSQIRLVLRIALAHGRASDRTQAAEVLAVVGAGFGFRAVARQAQSVVPTARWAVRSATAYSATMAVGEAARLRSNSVS